MVPLLRISSSCIWGFQDMGRSKKEKRNQNARSTKRSNSGQPAKPNSGGASSCMAAAKPSPESEEPVPMYEGYPVPLDEVLKQRDDNIEEDLQDRLVEKLEILYKEALRRIVELGYDKDVALKAILKSGYRYCELRKIVWNVVNDSVAYLNGKEIGGRSSIRLEFADLRELMEHVLNSMVHKVRQARPYLNKGDAMFCLLRCDLNVNVASTMELPSFFQTANDTESSDEQEKVGDDNNAGLVPGSSDSRPSDEDCVNSLLSKIQDLSIDQQIEFGPEEVRDEIIAGYERLIKDLEKQVKERIDWAQKKALQAAKKLTDDSIELKTLRMEKEDDQFVINENDMNLDESTMKRLADVERELHSSDAEAVQADEIFSQLLKEKAEIKAEMEAVNLSAREWDSASLELEKSEKKAEKKAMAEEKQTIKLQEEIANVKEKRKELENSIASVLQAEKEASLKWSQEVAAAKEAKFTIQNERRARKESELDKKLMIDFLKAEIDLKFKRAKDDIKRLEEERSRLLASPDLPDNKFHMQLTESSSSETISDIRECMICMNEEATVLFLPCAHMALCFHCNEIYGMGKKKGAPACPCCGVPIEERIHTFY
ncbi:MND1-interacting protein 1-like [Rutidosis leptorrhynchoides]|uniref:MND1-interacting protein 1-like n=1 Tax=Rutidosis leptorrhynchoides TaxID=125765 RepID=UPI003A9A0352